MFIGSEDTRAISFRADGGKGAPEGFVYSSDINEYWLDEVGLKLMLEG